MNKPKEILDSGFTIYDLVQESIEMNNFLKDKTNNNKSYNSLNKFFLRNIGLQNATKNLCYDRNKKKKKVS